MSDAMTECDWCECWSASGCSLMFDDGREIWWPRNAAPVWWTEQSQIQLTADEIAKYGDDYKHADGIRA